MAYLRNGYGNTNALPDSDPPVFTKQVRRLRDGFLPHSAVSHLLLMYGEDHTEARAVMRSLC